MVIACPNYLNRGEILTLKAQAVMGVQGEEKAAPCYSQLLSQTCRTLKGMFVTLIWTFISVTPTTLCLYHWGTQASNCRVQ